MEDGVKFEFVIDKKIYEGKNGFMIYRVFSKSESVKKYLNVQWGNVSVKGVMPELKKGIYYVASMDEAEYNEKYKNYSLNISNVVPRDFNSGNIKSDEDMCMFIKYFIGDGTANKVSNVKGICKIIQNEDKDALLDIKGIGEHTANKILNTYKKEAVGSYYLIKCKKVGFSDNEVNKLKDLYNDDLSVAYSQVKRNIFELVYSGFKLNRVDEMFLTNLDGKRDNKNRIKCYIFKNLKDKLYEKYKSYLTLDEFKKLPVVDNIIQSTSKELFDRCIKDLVSEDKIKIIDDKIITLSYEYKLEKKLAYLLDELTSYKAEMLPIKDIDKEIDEQEKKLGFHLNKGQRECVKSVVMSDKTIQMINGKAGTGKTTVTKIILRIFQKYGLDNFKLTALSGRASSVLGESAGFREKSGTIHRTLGFSESGFYYNYENKFGNCDVLVVDEIGMVSFDFLYNILAPVKEGMKVLILGDSGQLASLSFGDSIKTLKLFDINYCELTQVMRQSEDSKILYIANEVREHRNPFVNEKYVKMGLDTEVCIGDSYNYMIDSYIKDYKKDPTSAIIVTTTKSKVDMINFDIQDRLIKEGLIKTNGFKITKPSSTKGKFYEIYKNNYVMILKNDYSCENFDGLNEEYLKLRQILEDYNDEELDIEFDENDEIINELPNLKKVPVFNGEIYKIKEIYDKYGKVVLTDGEHDILGDYDKLQFQLANSATCHKLQGSGAESVYVYTDDSYIDTNMMVSCQFLYTSFTRSKKRLSIHTNKYSNLARGIKVDDINEKVTLIEYLHDNGKLINNK